MEIVLSILLGIALSATCGFRIFIPLLVMSVSGLSGFLSLSPSFEWIASYPALVVFAIAAIIEIIAYFIPYVDNLLNMISIPVATFAGIIVAAAVITDMSPVLKWLLAIIAGGGAASLTNILSNSAHTTSTAVSAGFANPIISAIETAGSIISTVLSVLFPVIAISIVLLFVLLFYKIIRKIERKRRRTHYTTVS